MLTCLAFWKSSERDDGRQMRSIHFGLQSVKAAILLEIADRDGATNVDNYAGHFEVWSRSSQNLYSMDVAQP